MAIDSTRISQVLPEVKCSKCSASISLDDMTTHTCTILPKLQPISERATNNGSGRGSASSQIDRGLFNSANYATPQNAYQRQVDNNSRADLAPNGMTNSNSQHKPSYSNASAVLGRLDSVKTGVLDATGFHRPQQQTRQGPVQLRDPRATIVPIQTNGRYQARDNFAMPSPVHEMPYPQQRMDDNMSVLSDRSGRSGRSARSGWSSHGHLSKPSSSGTDSCFSASSTDHGPFHHVGTKLDPRIFILDETPATKYTKKSNMNAKKVRKPIKDSYDDDWAEQGYDQDTIPYSQPLPRSQLPSHAGAAHYQPPPPLSRSNNFSQESSSSRESLPRQTHGKRLSSCDPARPQPQDPASFEDWHSRRQQLEAIRGQKQRNMSNSRPGTSESADSATDPYAHVPSRAHALPPHTRTHTRHETSSSLGTMLTTTSTAQSARSSTSSPPLSEQNFNHQKLYRDDNATPRLPLQYNESRTPRPGPTATKASAGQVTRSDTTESFDRLLKDIGSSIDELDTPKMPFAQQQEGSPSSNYSPNLPQPARFVPNSPAAAAIQRLGSPASLQSKETVSSQSSGSTQTRRDKRAGPTGTTTTTESRCRACDGNITGKSVSSADGKLSGRYHRACFRCAAPDCTQTKFPGGEFYVFADRPLCAVHYHAAAGSLCPHCGEGVEGACFATADGRKVHPACHAVSARF